MRAALAIFILAWTPMGLMDVVSAQVPNNQVSANCTPTKTINLDAPNADWWTAEQRDRERYNTTAQTQYSATEVSAMFERPRTVKQLLLNVKTAVDRDLLVQNGFYETPVLMKFFGASAIAWQEKPRFGGASQRVATLTFGEPAFASLQGYAKLMRSHIAQHDVTPNNHVEKHTYNQGEISLRVAKFETVISVRAVVDIFGMPIQAHRGCGDTSFGHGLSSDDPTCKGQIFYTYSKKDLPSALLAINQTEFTVRLDSKERKSPTWDLRSAEDRQRFLCDEDELRDISILQRGF
jgi:hypothetical protein